MNNCHAPIFPAASNWLDALLTRYRLTIVLAVYVIIFIFTLGAFKIDCIVRQLRFRMRYVRVGNEHTDIDLLHPWLEHVQAYGNRYRKSAEWEIWILGHNVPYRDAFERSLAKPEIVNVAFQYETTPIAYSPPWHDESEHMDALKRYAESVYAGWRFDFIFEGDPTTSYASVIAGTESMISQICGPMKMCLYYEGIFHHEFGHLMRLRHHYDEPDAPGYPMPPGEARCVMNRTSSQFCSACRTALEIPLDVDNEDLIASAHGEISSRYPY